jgi:phage-related minor tail protein
MATHVVSVIYEAKVDQYQGDVKRAADENRRLGETATRTQREMGTSMVRVGDTMKRNVTPAAVAAGAAFALVDDQFGDGADALRAAGAVGDEFVDSMRRVGDRTPVSLDRVGTTMANLYERTRLTGEPLENLTKQMLDLERVGQAVDVDSVTRMFGDWSIGADEMTGSLDMLYRVSQETGTTVSRLTDLTVRYGGPLRQLGFEFEDAALLMAKFEAEGVNTELVAGSMRVALGRMAKAGEEPIETFQRLVEEIAAAGSTGEANALALEAFGARAAPDTPANRFHAICNDSTSP